MGLLLLPAIISHAADAPAQPKPAAGPPSAWVKPQFFDRQALATDIDPGADQHWLLLERQVNAASNETFVHCIRQIRTVAGVQNGSDLKIDFNPGYQTLTMNWARLWRGANFINQLDTNKISLVRQERDLDEQLVNGEQTAMLVFEDVRVGDIVDYAYSVKGENPVFNGKFSTMFGVQMDEQVERLLNRVVWPAQRRFYPKAQGTGMQPIVSTASNIITCVWDLRHVPAVSREDMVPVWFEPRPFVQLTEFNNWAEVNRWALALFQNSSPLSPELGQKVAEWKRLNSHEQQVQAALKFVQDEVRYFGVEIGVSAEKPTDPATVFARRFGDCKDKSLLFVTLMRSLGIEAYPVLVNTQSRQTIENWLPAADVFDHCIAMVRFDGQTWWLDPTAGYQRGALAQHYLPNYGRGLVISPVTTGLSVIPQTTGMPLTTTTEYFDLGRKSGASDLKVVTVAEGRDADRLRATFASNKRSEIEKDYTHFYGDTYSGIKMASPIEVQDDEQNNRFQTTEYYTIDKAWIKSDQDGKYRCDFYPFCIASSFTKPRDLQRKFPVAVDYPEHKILRTEITVPANWTYQKENKSIIDPSFTFHKKSHREDNRLVIEYEYQALMEFVSPDRTGEYLEKLSAVSKCYGDSFVWR